MDSIAEQLLYVTVRLEGATPQGISVGTGFLYGYEERVFLVTNKHVVDNVTAGEFVLRKATIVDGVKHIGPGAGYPIRFNNRDFIGHPDADIDIAAMNISELINDIEASANYVFWKNITCEQIPTDDDVEKFISPVEELIFVGYPNGIWDSTHLVPITRKGITATPYYIPFQGKPQFLIDASVFPGSSGSPVFLYYNGGYPDRQGNFYGGIRCFFLGILSHVFTRTETGNITIKEVPTAQMAISQVQQMIDLGVVINARAVAECLKNYLVVADSNQRM